MNALVFIGRTLFVNELSRHGLAYTDEAIGHWERGRSVPERPVLLRVFRMLVEHDGVSALEDINQLLSFAELLPVDAAEADAYFPTLQRQILLPHVPRPDYRTLIGRDDDIDLLAERLTQPKTIHIRRHHGLRGHRQNSLSVWSYPRGDETR